MILYVIGVPPLNYLSLELPRFTWLCPELLAANKAISAHFNRMPGAVFSSDIVATPKRMVNLKD
jgi:hypothetical protein